MDGVEHDERYTAFRWTGGTRAGGAESSGGRRTDEEPSSILYVHGSGATHRVWASQYAPSGPRHPAAAVDLSGHGESSDVDTPPGPETLSAYVEDVTAAAGATDADVLVGNSLGGAVVLQAVLDGTLRPSALVLVGTGAKLAVTDELRESLTEDFEAAIDLLHGDDMLLHDPDAETRARSEDEMRAVGQRVTRRDFLTCHEFDVRDRLDEIAVPTLAICGQRDRLTPPRYHEYLAQNVRNGTFEPVPEAAHLVMAERPAAFDEKLATFLDSVDVV